MGVENGRGGGRDGASGTPWWEESGRCLHIGADGLYLHFTVMETVGSVCAELILRLRADSPVLMGQVGRLKSDRAPQASLYET